MTSYPVPEDACPACKKVLTHAAGWRGRGPREGDLTTCYHCGAILTFTGALKLRTITHQELQNLHPEERDDLETVQASIRKFSIASLLRKESP